jgi:hypothetical protein
VRAIKKGVGNRRAGSLRNQGLFFSVLVHQTGYPF